MKMICPKCNSEDVEIHSRVTGYMSLVSSWNRGKQKEFTDRYKYRETFKVSI